ncbi:MAG TPA: hypothetical protein VN829_21470 [Dongiaceae bacterium]|nr:hypothetical protein [Dongiaceae bacterium]
MNDQEFFDLALKVIGRRASDAEREQLEALLASRPEFKTQFEGIRDDARLAKKVLPLMEAAGSSSGEFPAYARERLLTKVRQTLGQTQPARARRGWNWRWALGFAVGAAAVVLLLLPMLTRPAEPIIQVAMLDTAGPVRGEDSELDTLKAQWKHSEVRTFDKAGQVDAWRTDWPSGAKMVAKVIYNRAAGEVRVILYGPSKPMEKAFPVGQDLAATLRQAADFIREQTGK